MKRNQKILSLFLMGLTFIIMSCSTFTKKENVSESDENKIYDRTNDVKVPDFAIQILKEGNIRFVNNQVLTDNIGKEKRSVLKEKGQKPFAVILTCSDSRVPPELIFDQGLGDLFVVRVAGNIIDSVVMGSIEYGAEHLHTSLIVVLGHEKCGAVKATVEGGEAPGSIPAICERIVPIVTKVKKTVHEEEQIVEKVIEGNVEAGVAILEKNKLLEHLTESGKLKIIGAIYHLESGEVTFY
jgi:carbonic anhydrase